MAKEYDLSCDEVGPLYEVLVSASGELIDGRHRLVENPNWPVKVCDHIQDKKHLLMARLIANVKRRPITRKEKTQWLSGLYEETHWTPKEMAKHLGMSERWVRMYLPAECKNQAMRELRAKAKEKEPVASLATAEESSLCSNRVVVTLELDSSVFRILEQLAKNEHARNIHQIVNKVLAAGLDAVRNGDLDISAGTPSINASHDVQLDTHGAPWCVY